MPDNSSSCPHCNQQHPADVKICPVTGQPLICEVCGHSLTSRSDECPNCGAILPPPVVPIAPPVEVPPTQAEPPPQEVEAEVEVPSAVEVPPVPPPALPKRVTQYTKRKPKATPPVLLELTAEEKPVQLCPSCGKSNSSDAIYCAYCARRLKEAQPEVKLPEIPKKAAEVPKKVVEAPKEIAKTPKEITLRFSFWPITVDFASRWFLWYLWQHEVVADWVFWIGQIIVISLGILVWASSRYNKIREDAGYSTTDFNVSPEITTWSVLFSLSVVGWGIYSAVSLSASWASWLRVGWGVLIFFLYGIYILILYFLSVAAPPPKAAPKKREWIRVVSWMFLVVVIFVGLAWGLAWLIQPEAFLPTATAEAGATATFTPIPGIGSAWTRPADGMVMMYVPAGNFTMGSDHGNPAEQPVHSVYLDAYWIDQTEVTNAMFQKFVQATGYETDANGAGFSFVYDGSHWNQVNGANWNHPKGPDTGIDGLGNHPVTHVSWNDANSYCQWAGGPSTISGEVRLPTEAEWEKAARGGLEGILYPWGDQSPTCTTGATNGAQYASCGGETVAVGTFSPNGYGLYDMAGNVGELVAGSYDVYPGGDPNSSDLFGPMCNVMRGGSWSTSHYFMRSSYRYACPMAPGNDTGFRCVRSLSLSEAATPNAAGGGKIAFVSERDGNEEIYVMNPDGSGQTNLTNTTADDWTPDWSPNREKIAFVSNRDGDMEIYVMNADGSGQTNLTNNPSNDTHPAWSPDGERIAFGSVRDGNDEIYVMNADGSGQTRLTNNLADEAYAAWSPNGERITFVSNRDGNREIYIMNADGSGQTRLTNNPASDIVPTWSPDGERIAFDSDRDGNREIYVVNADGSGQIRLTNNPADDLYPAWSPDGERIAFYSERDGNGEIYVMNADGSNLINLTNNPAKDSSPAWSPHGAGLSSDQEFGTPIVLGTASPPERTFTPGSLIWQIRGKNEQVCIPGGLSDSRTSESVNLGVYTFGKWIAEAGTTVSFIVSGDLGELHSGTGYVMLQEYIFYGKVHPDENSFANSAEAISLTHTFIENIEFTVFVPIRAGGTVTLIAQCINQ